MECREVTGCMVHDVGIRDSSLDIELEEIDLGMRKVVVCKAVRGSSPPKVFATLGFLD
jgi:hypothetical protein